VLKNVDVAAEIPAPVRAVQHPGSGGPRGSGRGEGRDQLRWVSLILAMGSDGINKASWTMKNGRSRMMIKALPAGFAMALTLISGCAPTSYAAVGKNTNGDPVSGALTGLIIAGKTGLQVSIVTASHGSCSGQNVKAATTAIITVIPIQCTDGSTGQATVTSDYVNARDTIDYRVGREKGRIVTGLSLQVAG